MKRFFIFCIAILLLAEPVFGYTVHYKEQYYRLYSRHLTSYPENITESIFYLEQALKADFANPLYAMAVIKTTGEWEHYRNVFMMHCNLMLVELFTRMASKYDRQAANFWLAPWKRENLASLKTAEAWYTDALRYWKDAVGYASKVNTLRYNLKEIQHWENDAYRIQSKELDYEDIIADHLKRLRNVRATIEAMDADTY